MISYKSADCNFFSLIATIHEVSHIVIIYMAETANVNGQFPPYEMQIRFHPVWMKETPSSAQKIFAKIRSECIKYADLPNLTNTRTPISPSASLSHLFIILKNLRELVTIRSATMKGWSKAHTSRESIPLAPRDRLTEAN